MPHAIQYLHNPPGGQKTSHLKDAWPQVSEVGCITSFILSPPFQLVYFVCERMIWWKKAISLNSGLSSTMHSSWNIFCSKLREMPDNSYDVVLCHNVLEYIKNREELIHEFVRVMKSDGFLHGISTVSRYPWILTVWFMCFLLSMMPFMFVWLYHFRH